MRRQVYELALFAGAGGGMLGSLLLGHRVVCYVENEPYCVEVLKARIRDGIIHDAPIWDDATIFDGRPWRGCVDLVSAGFPCQPFSVAGKREGADDPRNLWPATARILGEVRPRWVLLENVPGLLGSHGYFGHVLGDLAALGYAARWDCVPASAVGAPQPRSRLWVIAYADQSRFGGSTQPDSEPLTSISGSARNHALRLASDAGTCHGPKCRFCRRGDAVAKRVAAIRALGNGQVPAVVAAVWRMMTTPSPNDPCP